jgi:hypothetical protein
MQDQKLMAYFQFDEADLEANRKGEYSEGQKKRLFKGLFAPKKYYFKKVLGPISIESYKLDWRAEATVHYSLHVGKDKEFHATKDILNIVAKGDVYTVYYCNAASEIDQEGEDTWDKILSVEFIAKAPPESIPADGQAGSSQKRLEELKNMLDTGLISEQEFENKKKEILDQL